MHSTMNVLLIHMNIHRLLFDTWMASIAEPSVLLVSLTDVIKDFTLIVRLVAYVGGPLIVLTNPTLFSSNVSTLQAFLSIQQYERYCESINSIQMHMALLHILTSFRSSFCYCSPSFVRKFWHQSDFSNKFLIPARRIKLRQS